MLGFRWSLRYSFAALVLLAGCEDKAEDASDFCGQGTENQRGMCVAVLACGDGTTQINNRCELASGSTALTCGAGTEASGTACVVASEACGAGTTLVDGTCQPEVAGASCGPGTRSQDGTCILAAEACGAGTALGDGTCVLDATACGTDTALEDGSCVGTLSCGDATERSGDTCVGTLFCDSGQGAVEVVGDDGLPICVSETYEAIDATTLSARMAESYCDGWFRCCEAAPFQVEDSGGGDFGQYQPFTDAGTCVKFFGWFWDIVLALPEARFLLAQSPPRATFDIDAATVMADLFTPNEACEVEFTEAEIAVIRSGGAGFLGGVFQGSSVLNEPCSVSAGCTEGLICRDPDPQFGGDIRVCLAPATANQPCQGNDDCAGGLFCGFNPDLGDVCLSLLNAGGSCFEDEQCAAGLSCFNSGPEGQCQPVADPPDGFGCDTRDDCPTGEYCAIESGACLEILALGDTCSQGDECGEMAFCARDPGEETGVCATTIDACSLVFFD